MSDRRLGDERDEALGRELGSLSVPDHGPRFWDAVDGSLEREAHERDEVFAAALPDPALGERLSTLPLPDHGREYWSEVSDALAFESSLRRRRSHVARRRWPRIVAAAATAAAATFLFASWFGMPESIGGAGRALAHVFLPPLQQGLSSAAKVDGTTLVWTSRVGTDPSTGEFDVSVFAYDLRTRQLGAPLSTFPSPKKLAAVNDGKVVWFDGRDGSSTIHVYDLRTAAETSVRPSVLDHPDKQSDTADLVARGQAAISGDVVVWTDWLHGNGDIWSYDLASDVASPLAQGPAREEQPAISGTTVIWADGRNGTTGPGGVVSDYDIYGADVRTGKQFPVCISSGDQVHPAISDNIVVWQDGRDRSGAAPNEWNIYGYNVATQREFIVTDAPGPQTDPEVSNGVVVWTDGPRADGTSVIEGCDLRSGRIFRISDGEGAYAFPSISGDTVVWSSLRGDGSQLAVYGATISVSPRAITVTPIEK